MGQSTKDRLLEIQRDIALLQGAVQQSDRGTGERIAGLEALMKQNLEAITRLNQSIAAAAQSVVFIAAGLPLPLKSPEAPEARP